MVFFVRVQIEADSTLTQNGLGDTGRRKTNLQEDTYVTHSSYCVSFRSSEQARRFYMNVFGVKELSRSNAHPNNVMLSDGEIFINIVKRRDEHKKPAGFYHIGFHVDSVDLVRERLRNEGFSDASHSPA